MFNVELNVEFVHALNIQHPTLNIQFNILISSLAIPDREGIHRSDSGFDTFAFGGEAAELLRPVCKRMRIAPTSDTI